MRWLTIAAVLLIGGSVAPVGVASAEEPGVPCLNGSLIAFECGNESAGEASLAQTLEDQGRMVQDEDQLRSDERMRMPQEILHEDRNQLRTDLDPNVSDFERR
jgi:hypothetical protein